MTGEDPYLLADANVLRNCFGEKNPLALLQHEIFFSGLRIAEILHDPLGGQLDYDLLKRIHGFIFQDIYPDWAGSTRTVRIYKPERILDGNSVAYPEPGESGFNIEQLLNDFFADFADADQLVGLEPETYCEGLARFISRLWKIHPFREGNTRSVMVFFCYVSARAGYPLSLSYLDRKHRVFRRSLVKSTVGSVAGLQSNLTQAIACGARQSSRPWYKLWPR